MSKFMYISSVAGGDYLLDNFPAFAGYSLRQLKSGVTNCIRVRRASDSSEQDIGFVDGVLDVTSLATFCSGTTGYVKTWYDQSGGARNVTNATAAEQPRIYASGATDTDSGNYALKFSPTNVLDYSGGFSCMGPASAASLFTVASGRVTESIYAIVNTESGVTGRRMVQYIDTRTTPNRNWLIVNTTPTTYTVDLSAARTDTGNRLVTAIKDTSYYMQGFDNGTTGGTNTYTGTYVNDVFRLGAQHNKQTPLDGYMQEVIVYASDETSNRTSIEGDILTYYAI